MARYNRQIKVILHAPDKISAASIQEMEDFWAEKINSKIQVCSDAEGFRLFLERIVS